MKFVSFLINLLLMIVLVVTSLFVVVDLTVSAKYINTLATRTDAYTQLSALLPEQIVKMIANGRDNKSDNSNSSNPNNCRTSCGSTNTANFSPGGQVKTAQQQAEEAAQEAQILAGMKAALTPDFIRTTLTSIVYQGEAVLKGSASTIAIPLDQVGTRAKAAGLDVPADVFKPLILSTTDPSMKQLADAQRSVHLFERAKLVGLIAAGVLFLLSLFVSFWRGKYGALGAALIIAGLLTGVFVAGFWVAPQLALQKLTLPADLSLFAPFIARVILQLANDIKFKFLSIALALLAAGVLLELLNKHLPSHHQHEQLLAPLANDDAPKMLDEEVVPAPPLPPAAVATKPKKTGITKP